MTPPILAETLPGPPTVEEVVTPTATPPRPLDVVVLCQVGDGVEQVAAPSTDHPETLS